MNAELLSLNTMLAADARKRRTTVPKSLVSFAGPRSSDPTLTSGLKPSLTHASPVLPAPTCKPQHWNTSELAAFFRTRTQSHTDGFLVPLVPDIDFLFLSESLSLSEFSFLTWEMGLITTCVGHGDDGRGRHRERMWNSSIVSGHGETGLTCVCPLSAAWSWGSFWPFWALVSLTVGWGEE